MPSEFKSADKLYFINTVDDREDGAPVPAYLIKSGPHTILVDSGFPEAQIGQVHFGWRVSRERFILTQLARIGVRAEDVDLLIATHLDPDHAGNHQLFTNATVICQRAHHAWASQHLHQRTGGPGAEWTNPSIRWRFVDGDTDVADGVRVIECGGHVPAHQGVLVRLPSQSFVLAIDAIPNAGVADPVTRRVTRADLGDEAEVRACTRKLVDVAAQEHATLIYGHDGAQWGGLKTFPEGYG